MMMIKNPIEQTDGFIFCKALVCEEFVDFLLPPNAEYEIHESSEWADIKPCDPAEKDEYEAQLVRELILAQLTELDVPTHTVARALAGDEYALNLIKESEVKKTELRDKL